MRRNPLVLFPAVRRYTAHEVLHLVFSHCLFLQTEQTAVRRYMVLRFALWPERRAEYCASIGLYEAALNIKHVQIALGYL